VRTVVSVASSPSVAAISPEIVVTGSAAPEVPLQAVRDKIKDNGSNNARAFFSNGFMTGSFFHFFSEGTICRHGGQGYS
jgi:hypothetical protein